MDNGIDEFIDFNIMNEAQLIQPLNSKEFTTYWINNLYRDEQLTQDEYLVLDFIGINGLIKSGFVTMSFQGMKRIISLHQARLTKAINRLSIKDLLQKVPGGYALTEDGFNLFNRLFKQYSRTLQVNQKNKFLFVSDGTVQGPNLTKHQYFTITNSLVGRWFGKFRFTSKINYDDSVEFCWISTNGSIFASLVVGPNNKLRLSLSAPIQSIAQKELQLLIDHISQSLETVIDAPIIFGSFSVFKNKQKIKVDNASIPYAR